MFRNHPLYRILIGILLLLSTAHGETVAWPPESMRNLPADYLARLRACMVAGTGRMSRLRAGESTGKDSIGWVRCRSMTH